MDIHRNLRHIDYGIQTQGRDVRFIEDLERDANDTEEYLEIPLNSDWHKATNTLQDKSKTQVTASETDEETDPEEENEEETEEEKEEEMETPKILIKGPGRPKLIKTGKRGRSRKLYQEITRKEEISEPSSVKEIENRTDK